MNYTTFTQQVHLASKQRQQELKKQYPHYWAAMQNRAWSIIAQIRARKKDTKMVETQ